MSQNEERCQQKSPNQIQVKVRKHSKINKEEVNLFGGEDWD